jgi:hypothetical protein
MPKLDPYEEEILNAYEEGKLQSVASKEELAKFKAAARVTAVKDRSGNIKETPACGVKEDVCSAKDVSG